MNREKFTSPGNRLKRARVLAGITTRREFEEKHEISANTLQGWEQGKNPLSLKGAKRVIEAFKNEGLLCSVDWLMKGVGMPPRPYEMINAGLNESLQKDNNVAENNLQEEEAIYQEIQNFKSHNANAFVISITDDAMEPYFTIGDYIGGVRIERDQMTAYLGNACIIELPDHTMVPRYLHAGTRDHCFNLSCTNPKTKALNANHYNVEALMVAPIVWHRRKLLSMHNKR